MDRARRILSGGWLSTAISVLTRGLFESGEIGDSVDFTSTAIVHSPDVDTDTRSITLGGNIWSVNVNASLEAQQ